MNTMQGAARAWVSEAEFLTLPESVDKVELVDGEVIVSPSPSYWHQEVLTRLVGALRTWAAAQPTPITVAQAPLDVRFAKGRILQPDALVLFARISPAQEGPIERVPELCVEVLSTDRVYDRVTKRLLYAAAGVQEYWTVEPAGMVERWHGPGLSRVDELHESLTSALLPGFAIDIKQLTAVEL